MKIALLSEKYTPDIGGLAISAGRLAMLLTSAGHEIRVFAPTLSLPAPEKQTLVRDGISVTRFGEHKRVSDTLVDWFELVVAEHQRDPFDLLQAYYLPQAGFVASYAGNYLGLPSVVSARGNDLERAAFDPARATHILYALQHATAVTTNTTEMVKKAQALVPGLEVTLIPNSLNIHCFVPMSRNEMLAQTLGIEDYPVIGFVGELREKKGMHTLLDAYTKLSKNWHASLLILGDVRPGADKRYLDGYKNYYPDTRIKITGFVSPEEMPEYYSLIDLLVLPSLRDGLPNALVEGMSCEKAVIATPVGGIKDVIRDGINGKLVPVRDANHLATAIEELLVDKPLRLKLGKAARETVVKNFTFRKELDANLALYQKLGTGK